MAEFRATVSGVQGKPGTASNPRNGAVIKLLTFQIEAGQELLALQGHDCVVSIMPLDQQMFADAREEATAEANGTEPAPIERRRRARGRAAAGTSEVAEVATGP
jgi:hypothetical protein